MADNVEIRAIEDLPRIEIGMMTGDEVFPVVRSAMSEADGAEVKTYTDHSVTVDTYTEFLSRRIKADVTDKVDEATAFMENVKACEKIVDEMTLSLAAAQEKLDANFAQEQEKLDANFAEKSEELKNDLQQKIDEMQGKLDEVTKSLATLDSILAMSDKIEQAGTVAARIEKIEKAIEGRLYDFTTDEDGAILNITTYTPPADEPAEDGDADEAEGDDDTSTDETEN